MKKIILIFSSILFSFAISILCVAQKNYTIEKTKLISKIYPLSAGQKVNINNQFGKVVINNWNKSDVKAEITIITNSKDEASAQKLLDEIVINENIANAISFETKIGNSRSGSKTRNGTNSSMQINYDVYMPQGNPLMVKNSFGNTYIPSRNGLTELYQSFGDLTTGKLTRVDDLKVEFGKLMAESIQGNKIKSSYSDVNVKELAGILSGSFDFCSKLQLGLTNQLESLTINTSYSDLRINVPSSFNGSFYIKTSFGDVKNKSALKLTDATKEKKYGPVFDKTYNGQSGNGKASIKINTSFGNVSFN